jgi:hypothetical protein
VKAGARSINWEAHQWPYRLADRTSDFQSDKRSSTLRRATGLGAKKTVTSTNYNGDRATFGFAV